MELALKLDESKLNDRAIRVSRCKKNPKPHQPEPEKNAKENGKESGAYKRIKHKETQKERQKGAGWITKMKRRNKESTHKQAKVSSFAGETTGDSVKVWIIDCTVKFKPPNVLFLQVVKTGKVVKSTKEENRKKQIAAKLAFVNKKK